MKETMLFGLITQKDPLILVIGTDQKKIMSYSRKETVLFFKYAINSGMISLTGFEPIPEHFNQVRIYIQLMLQTMNPLPVCQENVGGAKIIN